MLLSLGFSLVKLHTIPKYHDPSRPSPFYLPPSLTFCLLTGGFGQGWCLAPPLGGTSLPLIQPTHWFATSSLLPRNKRPAETSTLCQIVVTFMVEIRLSACAFCYLTLISMSCLHLQLSCITCLGLFQVICNLKDFVCCSPVKERLTCKSKLAISCHYSPACQFSTNTAFWNLLLPPPLSKS